MSKQEPAEQVKFLVSCIGHTSNGRPDFGAVAEELGIVSKAAAQKRYERMLKANGVTANKSPTKAATNDDQNAPETPVKRRKANGTAATGSAKKKAKVKKDEEMVKTSNSEGEDDEVKTKATIKKQPLKKEEDDGDSVLSDPPEFDDAEI